MGDGEFWKKQNLHIVPTDASLGAEVFDCALTELDDITFKSVLDSWLFHLVLVFRSQSLDAHSLVRLARRFGSPVSSIRYREWTPEDFAAHQLRHLPQEISVISNVKEEGKPIGLLGDGEVLWHSDFSYRECPTSARMLFAIEIPAEGGNTYFLNGYAAYDALPTKLKRRVSGKFIKQFDSRQTDNPSHPIISTHPDTKCNSLFLGRKAGATVDGLTKHESDALLNELWAHCENSEFIYEHRWSVGDLVVWDNRCTLHRREAFDSASRRVLHAVQVEGHRPYEAPNSLDLPPHPRAQQGCR